MTYEELSKDFMSKAYNGEINRDVAMVVIRVCAIIECATTIEPLKYKIVDDRDVHIYWPIGKMMIKASEATASSGYVEFSSAAKEMGIMLRIHEATSQQETSEGKTLQ
jgi:hypothetical protein